MRIKHLEIKGFKSFKSRIKIPFQQGINCVVGPNGCGKSNILDALLWVMGETAPSRLRSSSMEELLFTGKQNNSTGAVEVSLVLEKTNKHLFPRQFKSFSEIMITRRLIHEGQSEYFINSQPCRLADVQDFFMDTGAGIHGFSFIEQGAVEQFISSKPAQKRLLIESAAGISRFRTRKKEASKKLLLTENHLKNLKILLERQTKELEKLKRQSKKAEQFKDLKKQIREKDIFLSLHSKQSLQKQLHSTNNQCSELEKQCSTHQQQIQQLDDSIGKLNSAYKEKQTELEKYQKNEKLLQDQSLVSQTTLAGLKASLQANTDNKNQFFQDMKTLQNKYQADLQLIEETTNHIKHLESKILNYEEQYNKLDKEYKNHNQRFLISDAQKRSVESELMKLNQKEIAWQKMNQVLKESTNEINLREEDYLQQLKRKKDSLTALNAHQNQLVNQLDQEAQTQFSWSDSVDSLKQDIQFFQKEIQMQQQNIQQSQSKLQALHLEMKNLQKLKPQSLDLEKSIFKNDTMDSPKEIPHRFSYLTDTIKISSEEWDPAFKMFLGPKLKSIFCQKTESVLSLLSHLKPEQKQKGLRFILKEYQRKKIPDENEKTKLKAESGFLFFFTDKLEGDSEWIHLLFSHTAAVTNISIALKLKHKYPEWCFITKNKEILTQDGELITGNTHIHGQMTVMDYNRLETIPKQHHQQETQIEFMKRKLKKTQSLFEKTTKKLEELNNQQNHSQISTLKIKKDLELYHRDKENLITEISVFKKKLESVQQKKEELYKKQSSLEKEFSSPQIHSLQLEFEKAEREYRKWEKEKTDTLAEKDQLSLKKQSIEKEIKVLKEKHHILNLSLKANQDREKSLLSISGEKDTLIQNYEKLVTEQELKQKDHVQRLREQNKTIIHLKKQCDNILKQISHQQSELKTHHQSLSKQESTVHEWKLKQKSLLLKEEALQNRIFDLYQVDLSHSEIENSDFQPNTEINNDKKAQELEDLKIQLNRMGAVNLLALKEYKELDKEHQFYQKQYDDLCVSKEKLTEVIKRIESFCSRKFMETFEKVNSYFAKVFAALFEGGEARLILTEMEEKEEQGLDIMVQPPGKKIQNMNLLSGGEKAMTAVALIFSVFLIKPSPFCILDEIDASLDDVNINRFNSLLSEMSTVSQVIIITHNKLTMRSADKIFGVTMEEKGISKVLSMDMKSSGFDSHPTN